MAATRLGQFWHSIQTWLFPAREDELGELANKHQQSVAVTELCRPQDFMQDYRWVGNGCPPKGRLRLCKAFIAKAVWGFPTTRDLIDAVRHRPTLCRLCGWDCLGDVRHDLFAWPGHGGVDGSAHLIGDHGLIFLFNPATVAQTAAFALTPESTGFTGVGPVAIRQEYPASERRQGGRPGDTIRWEVPAQTAVVLRLAPAN